MSNKLRRFVLDSLTDTKNINNLELRICKKLIKQKLKELVKKVEDNKQLSQTELETIMLSGLSLKLILHVGNKVPKELYDNF